MKYILLLLLGFSAHAIAQFAGAIVPPTMTACGQKCIKDTFSKVSTACGKDKYQCYCTKLEFYTGLGSCSIACGEDTDLDVSEWRNIFCQAGAGAPAYTPLPDLGASPAPPVATPSPAPSPVPSPLPSPQSPLKPAENGTAKTPTKAAPPKGMGRGLPKGPASNLPKGFGVPAKVPEGS